MVQDQLVEYVSTQLKLGVARDAIKSALTGVGWAPLDVEDTLKKVEGGAPAAPAQSPVMQRSPDTAANSMASPKVVSFSAPGTVASAKNPEPQTIRVSDLISSSPSIAASSSVAAPKIISGNADTSKTPAKYSSLQGSSPSFISPPSGKKKSIGLVGILAVVLIVALGILSGYLFVKNNGLNSQLQTVQSGQQTQGAAQTSVVAQVQALSASNTALTAQISSLTATNQDLMTSLSLFAVPTDMASPVTSSPVTVSGVLSAGLGKNTYVVTTVYGAKAYVKNSSTAAVAAALQPLLGTTVQISGTYLPGTPNIIVDTINGSPVSPPTTTTTTTTTVTTATTTTPAPPTQ